MNMKLLLEKWDNFIAESNSKTLLDYWNEYESMFDDHGREVKKQYVKYFYRMITHGSNKGKHRPLLKYLAHNIMNVDKNAPLRELIGKRIMINTVNDEHSPSLDTRMPWDRNAYGELPRKSRKNTLLLKGEEGTITQIGFRPRMGFIYTYFSIKWDNEFVNREYGNKKFYDLAHDSKFLTFDLI